MLVVPLQPLPSQTLAVNLGGQACQINVYQKRTALYLDLLVNGAQIVGGVICENLNRIVRDLYLGFSGDLAFFDSQGSSDPFYSGLGLRFSLLYVEASELPPNVG